MASDAPCPELGDVGCAASPTSATRPACQVGTVGMSSIAPTTIRSAGLVRDTRSSAGPRSFANASRSRASHCSGGISAHCALVSGSSLGRFTNQPPERSSSTWYPKNARLPKMNTIWPCVDGRPMSPVWPPKLISLV